MQEIKNKCQGCGSELSFNAKEQALVCHHCDQIVQIKNSAPCEEKQPFTDATIPDKVKSSTTQYFCSSCGKRNSHHEKKELKKCTSCGSSEIRKTIDLKYNPSAIIPFKKTNLESEGFFKAWVKKRWFAPSAFKKQAALHNLSPRYYPTWVFATKVTTTYSGVGVSTHTDISNKRTHRTKHSFSGTEKNFYSNIIQLATIDSIRNLEDNLGYFGTDNPISFRYEYLYGYDVKDIKLELNQAWKCVQRDIKSQEERNIKSKHNYESYEWFCAKSFFEEQKYMLVYVPIFELNYKYKKKLYTCYVNGYSGTITGTSPKSALKIFALVASLLLFFGSIFILMRALL